MVTPTKKRIRFLSVRLTSVEHQDLREISEKADVPVAYLVRALIRKHLPIWEQQLEEDRLSLVLQDQKERIL